MISRFSRAIAYLRQFGHVVYPKVDARQLHRIRQFEHKFDKVYFNFPQVGRRAIHETGPMIDAFMKSARDVLKKRGIIHMGIVRTPYHMGNYGIDSARARASITRKAYIKEGLIKRHGSLENAYKFVADQRSESQKIQIMAVRIRQQKQYAKADVMMTHASNLEREARKIESLLQIADPRQRYKKP